MQLMSWCSRDGLTAGMGGVVGVPVGFLLSPHIDSDIRCAAYCRLLDGLGGHRGAFSAVKKKRSHWLLMVFLVFNYRFINQFIYR